MGRTKSPVALKTEQARKYDAMRIKDNLRRIDAARPVSSLPESAKGQLRTGAMFVFSGSMFAERERETRELRNIEERIARGLDADVTMLRIYPQVLVKRPEQVVKWCCGVTLSDINRLVEHYKKEGYYDD